MRRAPVHVRIFDGPESFVGHEVDELPDIARRLCPWAGEVLDAVARAGSDLWGAWTGGVGVAPWSALGVRAGRQLRNAFEDAWRERPLAFAALALVAASARMRTRLPSVLASGRSIVVIDDTTVWWIGDRRRAPVRLVADAGGKRALFAVDPTPPERDPYRPRPPRVALCRRLRLCRWRPELALRVHGVLVGPDDLRALRPEPWPTGGVAVVRDVPETLCEAVLSGMFAYTVHVSPHGSRVWPRDAASGRRPARRRGLSAALFACGAMRPYILERFG